MIGHMEWLAVAIWEGLEREKNVPVRINPVARDQIKAKILALEGGPREAACFLLILGWYLDEGLAAPDAALALFNLSMECDPSLEEDIPKGVQVLNEVSLESVKRGFDRFAGAAGDPVKSDAPKVSALTLRLNIRG
jgi:hypothetical protein